MVDSVVPTTVSVVGFEPATGDGRRGPGGVAAAGTLAGYDHVIGFDVARVETARGVWARVHTVKVFLRGGEGVTEEGLAGVRGRVVGGVDGLFNVPGYRLPASGDVLHVRVRFVDEVGSAHAVVDVDGGGSGSAVVDQAHWGVDTPGVVLAHEVGHYLGLRDEYRDPGRVFLEHRRGRGSGRAGETVGAARSDGGLMGDGVHGKSPVVHPRHLRVIEDVVVGQVVVPELSLGGGSVGGGVVGSGSAPRAGVGGGHKGGGGRSVVPGPKGKGKVVSAVSLGDEGELRSLVEVWRTRRWQDVNYWDTLCESLGIGPRFSFADQESPVVKVFMEEGRRLLNTRLRHPVTGGPTDVNLTVSQVASLLGVYSEVVVGWGLGQVEASISVEGSDRESVDREMRELPGDEPARLAAMARKWHELGTPGTLLEFIERYIQVRVGRQNPGSISTARFTDSVRALVFGEARRLFGAPERDRITGSPTGKKLTASRMATHLGISLNMATRLWKEFEGAAGRQPGPGDTDPGATGSSGGALSSSVLGDEAQLRSLAEGWRARRWRDAGYTASLRDFFRERFNDSLEDLTDSGSPVVKVFVAEGRRLLGTRQRHPVTGGPTDVNLTSGQVMSLLGVDLGVYVGLDLGSAEVSAPAEGHDRESVDREMRELPGDVPARLAAMARKWHELGTPGTLLEFIERYMQVRSRGSETAKMRGIKFIAPFRALLRDEARRLFGAFERDRVTGLPTGKKLTGNRMATHLGVSQITATNFWKELEGADGQARSVSTGSSGSSSRSSRRGGGRVRVVVASSGSLGGGWVVGPGVVGRGGVGGGVVEWFRLVPVFDGGGGGFLEAVVESALRHSGFGMVVGVTRLGGMTVAGLRDVLFGRLREGLLGGDEVLSGLLSAGGWSVGEVVGLLDGEGAWGGAMVELVAYLVGSVFGVRVSPVGPEGGVVDVGGPGGEEVVVFREVVSGRSVFRGVEPVVEDAGGSGGGRKRGWGGGDGPGGGLTAGDLDRWRKQVGVGEDGPGVVPVAAVPSGRWSGSGFGFGGGGLVGVLVPPVVLRARRTVGAGGPAVWRVGASSATESALPPVKGKHRRHIVPSHLFRGALNGWLDAHYPHAGKGREVAAGLLRGWQKALDNHVGNLWMGDGGGNLAAGGLTRTLVGFLARLGGGGLSGPEAAAELRKVMEDGARGKGGWNVWALRPDLQKALAWPVTEAFLDGGQGDGVAAEFVAWLRGAVLAAIDGGSAGWDDVPGDRLLEWGRRYRQSLPVDAVEVWALVSDMHDSADFDWPGGGVEEFAAWMRAYQAFRGVETDPGGYSAAQLQRVLTDFVALPGPDEYDFVPDDDDDVRSMVTDTTFMSELTDSTDFVGDPDVVLESRTRGGGGPGGGVLFGAGLEEARGFAEGREETLDDAWAVLAGLDGGGSDAGVAAATGHSESTVAAYRARFRPGSGPGTASGPGPGPGQGVPGPGDGPGGSVPGPGTPCRSARVAAGRGRGRRGRRGG